ncbi:MAG: hypothetical protein GTO63_21585, partial [Anaerolineae bacterium]|nr:hypothetical protein [Anaerolineae bacterium]NIQ80299.1 hypothetical protein [Anaerolineae bacterium]
LLQNKLDVLARPGEFTFVFDAGQFKALKKLKAMSDAGFRGEGAGGFAQAGRLPDIYGIQAYLTNQVETASTGKRNLLFHREWAAWAIQRNMDMSMKDPSDRLSTVAIVDYLAGFQQVRSDHAISILSK